MQKKWYGIMLLLSFLPSVSAQEEDAKNDAGRVGGTIRVVEPNLHNFQDEKDIKNKEVEQSEKKNHKKQKSEKIFKIKKDKLEKKNQVKKKKRQNKKEIAEKKIVVSSFKDHVVMAHDHEHYAQKQQHVIQKIRHELSDLTTKIEALELLDRDRIQSVTQEEKNSSLINARHAETEKDQKILDYIASRTHGTSEHPDLYDLRKKRQSLRSQLKKAMMEEKEHINSLHDHYKKADLEDVSKHMKAKHRDDNIIYGRSSKKTRKNLNETSDQIEHKQSIEEQRKEHAAECEKIKKRHSDYKKQVKKDRKKKHKAIQKKAKDQDKVLEPVVQKMN